jgi:hypothetical protein
MLAFARSREDWQLRQEVLELGKGLVRLSGLHELLLVLE